MAPAVAPGGGDDDQPAAARHRGGGAADASGAGAAVGGRGSRGGGGNLRVAGAAAAAVVAAGGGGLLDGGQLAVLKGLTSRWPHSLGIWNLYCSAHAQVGGGGRGGGGVEGVEGGLGHGAMGLAVGGLELRGARWDAAPSRCGRCTPRPLLPPPRVLARPL